MLIVCPFCLAALGLPCCARALPSCGVWASPCGGFSCCGAWAQCYGAQHVESSGIEPTSPALAGRFLTARRSITCLFDHSHPSRCEAVSCVVLIFIPLITSHIEHLFMCFIGYLYYSLEKCLFKSFAYFQFFLIVRTLYFFFLWRSLISWKCFLPFQGLSFHLVVLFAAQSFNFCCCPVYLFL